MKRLFALLLTLIISLGILTACGKGDKATLGLGTAVSYTDGAEGTSSISVTEVTVAAVILDGGKIKAIAVTSFADGYKVSDRGVYTDREAVKTDYDTDALIGLTESDVSGRAMNEALRTAVLSAIRDAKSESAAVCSATDKLGIAIEGSGSGANADFYIGDGMNGAASTDATYTAVALDAEGKVSAAALDAIQLSRTFGATGTLAQPDTGAKTKRELGYDYGMLSVSGAYGIGREWFEQASGFCAYLVGKTADGIGSIGISGQGKPTDSALLSSCTIAIGSFVSTAKAAALGAN